MDIRRRNSQQGIKRTDKPVRTVADIRKPHPTPLSDTTPTQVAPELPLATPPEPTLIIKQAEEILAHSSPAAEQPQSDTETANAKALVEQTNDKKEAAEAVKTIEIKIVLPALFSLSKAAELSKQPLQPVYHGVKKQIAKTSKKTRIATASLMVVAVALVVGYTQLYGPDTKVTADTQEAGREITLPLGTPDYATLLPASKAIEDLGGWRRVSPPDKDPVFVYVDAIGPTSISVSQQPLPEDFKTDISEKVRQLAADFNANEKITVGSTTAFIGKSADGPQSVIFHKNNLLILMKSRGEIKNAEWADYIKQLQ